MGVCKTVADEIKKHLPCRILSLGYPDHLHGNVDLKGSTLDCVDIFAHHGNERVSDLSLPQELGEYDLVIDCGTTEHCANIGQAFINAANAVNVGGHIIHHVPLNMLNHGYWNISPSWFFDFYKHNRFTVERLEMTLNGSFHDCHLRPWPTHPTEDIFVVGHQALTLCVARREFADRVSLPLCQAMWKK